MPRWVLSYLKEGLMFGAIAAAGLFAMSEIAGASGIISDRIFGRIRKPGLIMISGTVSLLCLALTLWTRQDHIIMPGSSWPSFQQQQCCLSALFVKIK